MLSYLSRIIIYGSAFSGIRMMIGATSALYLLSKGITLSRVGMIKSFQILIMLFIDVPIGYFSDKLGCHRSLCLAALMGAIWLLLTAIAQQFSLLLLAEAFNSIALCLFNSPYSAMLASGANKTGIKIQKAYANSDKYCFASMAFFAFVGGFFSINSDFLWYLSGGLLLLVFLLGLKILPDLNRNADLPRKSSGFFKDIVTIVKIAIKDNSLLSLILFYCLIFLAYQVMIQFWQFFVFDSLQSSGKLKYYGALFTMILLTQSLAAHSISYIKTNSNKLFLAYITIGFVASALFVLFKINYNLLLVLFLIIIFLIMRSILIILDSKFSEALPDDARATLISLKATFSRKVVAFFLPVVGLAMQGFGFVALIYTNLIIFGVILIYLFLNKFILVKSIGNIYDFN